MLLPVEEGNFAAESGKKAALHFRILRKMMRGKGEGEVWMSGQLCEPLDGVWCSENLTAMIFYCNGDAVFGGGIYPLCVLGRPERLPFLFLSGFLTSCHIVTKRLFFLRYAFRFAVTWG